jgi:membrane-associated phospholipid phosphatase|tara:strand:- start:529 stop:972 length:444 start_codon:yes stop_codon:yes gene_type:complete
MGLINSFLKKEFFAFERPGFYEFENIEYLEPVFKYGSFPSGHAATIFVIIFIWLGLAIKKGFKYKLYLYGILITLASFVAISRVIVGAHWMSDILASIGIAFLFRAFVDLKFFHNHITQSKVLKYLSYVVVLTAWVNILFFDISDYF